MNESPSTASIDELKARGRIQDLCVALERALAEALPAAGAPYREPGLDPVEESARWHELGRWQWHAARMAVCERSLSRALALRERVLGPTDARTIDTLERIAALHHYSSRAEAAPLFERVIAAREAAHGRESTFTAISLRNWGAYLRDQADARAEGVLDEARQILERRAGRDDPEYAAALKAHAFCVLSRDREGWRGLELAERAYGATLRAHLDEHPFVAGALMLVARGELRLGRTAAAKKHMQEVLASFARGYGNAHPLYAIGVGLTGDIAFAEEDFDAALAARERSFEIYRHTYPTGRSILMAALRVMALHLHRKNPDAAWPWVKTAASLVQTDAGRFAGTFLLHAANLAARRGEPSIARALASPVAAHAAPDSELGKAAAQALAWCDRAERIN